MLLTQYITSMITKWANTTDHSIFVLMVTRYCYNQLMIYCLTCLGTKVAGHFDNLVRLREISTEYNIWLHVEGWVVFCCPGNIMITWVTAAVNRNAVPLLCLKNETLELKVSVIMRLFYFIPLHVGNYAWKILAGEFFDDHKWFTTV